jgi:hypothetical protein
MEIVGEFQEKETVKFEKLTSGLIFQISLFM